MQLFRTLLNRRLRPQESSRPRVNQGLPEHPGYPLGLSSDNLAQLRSLSQTPQYRVFEEAIARLHELNAKPLFSTLNHDQFLFQAGVCNALEKVYKLLETIDTQSREIDEHFRRTTESGELAAAGQRIAGDLALYGSAFWDAYQRGAAIHRPDGTADTN